MKYGFVKEHRSTFSVSLMCQLFQVSTSGFYDWNKNIPSQRERANQALDANIIDIFNINKFRYGSPLITKLRLVCDALLMALSNQKFPPD